MPDQRRNPLTADQLDRLTAAFDAALNVYREMNPVKLPCPTCGCAVYDDADLWHMRQMLGAAVARIEKVIKWREPGTARFVPSE